MEVTIIRAPEENAEASKRFGVLTNKVLTVVKMSHWYIKDYDIHVILGNLYDSLVPLLDALQEEIISLERTEGALFPSISSESISIDLPEDFPAENAEIVVAASKALTILTASLHSIDFNNFLQASPSGIASTREDIMKAINKAFYLISIAA